MKVRHPPNWTIAGLGPLLVIGCAAAMLCGADPNVVLACLAVSVLVICIVAEFVA